MLVLLTIVSVGLLGVIIYFAISQKTARLHRIAAIIALGLIFITLAVCGIIIIKGPAVDPQAVPIPIFQDMAQPVRKGPSITDIAILVVILLILAILIAKAYKDQKKQAEAEIKAKAAKAAAFPVHDELDLKEAEPKEELKLDDSSFNIEIK